MMDREKRHRRVVRQRILATVFTILVLAAIIFGIVIGIKFLRDSEIFERKPKPEPEVVSEAPSEETSETDDSWVEVQKEEIEDDYADVDTSVLSENEVPETPETDTDEEIESVISNLDMEEKVAQLFIVTPEEITGMTTVTRAGDTTKDALTLYPVGGLIYFAQNFEDPDQTKEMLANTKQYITDACGIPPFLGIDEEGGSVVRIAGNEAFGIGNVGPMADIGKMSEAEATDAAYNAGTEIGRYMSELGFNLDFAPVADVIDTKTSGGVIGDRAFGSDPELVSKLSWQFASGLQENGITPCFKHFPGHGAASEDTHAGPVILDRTRNELYASDLIPFQNAITNEAPMIMVSHLSCPGITDDVTPASLSYIMITDVLRGELGYKGIIITDSFQMGAVTSLFPDSGKAAVSAIKAGADIVLMPDDFNEAYHAVLSAASSGEIEEQRIDDSLRRILRVKLGK
ncbi:MAG: glycoside hydrolase family 3 protein [Lachnospiraceae bacterium]|nr:glycoside hydrolase family 3 protein [Lachnospiraceae bacterium]